MNNIANSFQVQGAVFDLPEEIAKELLNKQLPPGNSLVKITKVVLLFLFSSNFFLPSHSTSKFKATVSFHETMLMFV